MVRDDIRALHTRQFFFKLHYVMLLITFKIHQTHYEQFGDVRALHTRQFLSYIILCS